MEETLDERLKRLGIVGFEKYYEVLDTSAELSAVSPSNREGKGLRVRLPKADLKADPGLVDKVFGHHQLTVLQGKGKLVHRRTVENPDDWVLEYDVVEMEEHEYDLTDVAHRCSRSDNVVTIRLAKGPYHDHHEAQAVEYVCRDLLVEGERLARRQRGPETIDAYSLMFNVVEV